MTNKAAFYDVSLVPENTVTFLQATPSKEELAVGVAYPAMLMPPAAFGDYLRNFFILAAMRPVDVARQTGITQAAISQFRSGANDLMPTTANKIYQALGGTGLYFAFKPLATPDKGRLLPIAEGYSARAGQYFWNLRQGAGESRTAVGQCIGEGIKQSSVVGFESGVSAVHASRMRAYFAPFAIDVEYCAIA